MYKFCFSCIMVNRRQLDTDNNKKLKAALDRMRRQQRIRIEASVCPREHAFTKNTYIGSTEGIESVDDVEFSSLGRVYAKVNGSQRSLHLFTDSILVYDGTVLQIHFEPSR